MEEKESLLVEESLLNPDENKSNEDSNKSTEIINDEQITEKDIPKKVPTPLPKKQVCEVIS